MKKRRTVVALFLICATLVLTFGFAQLQSSLSINGGVDVTAKNKDLKVVFIAGEAATGSEGKLTASVDGTSTTANLTVTGISAAGESVTAEFTIQNQMTDLTAWVFIPSVTNNYPTDISVNAAFEGATTATDNTGTAESNNTFGKEYVALAPNATVKVIVTVQLTDTHTQAANYPFAITMVTKTDPAHDSTGSGA